MLPNPSDAAVEAAARAIHVAAWRQVLPDHVSDSAIMDRWDSQAESVRALSRRAARAALAAAAPILAKQWAEEPSHFPPERAIRYDGSVDLNFLRPNEKVRNAGPNGSRIEVITEYVDGTVTFVVEKGQWIVRGKDGALTAALTPGGQE